MCDFGEGQMESNFEKNVTNIIAHKFLTVTKGDMTWSEGLTTCNIMFTNADQNITCHTIMHQPQRCRWSALAEGVTTPPFARRSCELPAEFGLCS